MTALPKPADPAAALGAAYDAWNRVVAVSEGGVLIAKFSYDAAGRRILQQLADAQEPDQYIHFYHSGQQVVETRTGDDSAGVPDPAQLDAAYQFVWSPRYIDALILRDQYDAQGQLDAGARLFYLADANHNVTALLGLVETEPDVFEWQVVERYVYSPYGAVTIYTPDWSATRSESAFDNTTLYTGREFDSATGLYYYRARYYHAQLGQFISRDPIGYEAGDVNLYRYVGNRPIMVLDPTGLQPYPGYPLKPSRPPTPPSPPPPFPETGWEPGSYEENPAPGDPSNGEWFGRPEAVQHYNLIVPEPEWRWHLPRLSARIIPQPLILGNPAVEADWEQNIAKSRAMDIELHDVHYGRALYAPLQEGYIVGVGGAGTCVAVVIVTPARNVAVYHLVATSAARPPKQRALPRITQLHQSIGGTGHKKGLPGKNIGCYQQCSTKEPEG